ncbi:MAG: hypothetical protein Q8K92_08475 [Leadbetterella sp.]|nr:hypothetical protein [Leadbetterella sp.]
MLWFLDGYDFFGLSYWLFWLSFGVDLSFFCHLFWWTPWAFFLFYGEVDCGVWSIVWWLWGDDATS